MTVTILPGDCRDVLATLPAESVQCCVTSPPYLGLRSYLPDGHADKGREIGLEQTPAEYVEQLVAVFREVRRVLRPDGTLWLNLGDSYATQGGRGEARMAELGRPTPDAKTVAAARGSASGTKIPAGLKAKDLMMIPNRVAIALQDDGWWVRSEIIWSKAAPMPESVRDRPTCAHEKVWLLTRSARYFYDADAVAEPAVSDHDSGNGYGRPEQLSKGGRGQKSGWTRDANPTRNLRNVWHLGSEPCALAHFATMPPTLAERCIKAGTSEKGCCPSCGAPWGRVIEAESRPNRNNCNTQYGGHRGVSGGVGDDRRKRTDLGWSPSCSCPPHEPVPCTVLDPFAGAGTTLLVADRLQRHGIGIELNPEYIAIAQDRLRGDAPLFAEVA